MNAVTAKPKANLAPFFAPKGVAIVGASEDQSRYGGRVLKYAIDGGFAGGLYPVNPKYKEAFGLRCYPDLGAIDEPVDVVVALLGAERLPALYDAAAAKGATAIIVVGELTPGGKNAEREAWFRARIAAGGPRLVGPMCMGALAPHARLSMSGSSTLPLGLPAAGPVGLVTQSGGILSGVIDRSRNSGVGFSGMVSSGGEFDLDTCDFIEHYIEDSKTRAIAAYAEGLDDYARLFALAGRARLAGKPIVLLKPGFSEAGQSAALSHTGRVAGDRAIQASAFRRHGIVLASDIDDLHATAALLAGPRMAPGTGVGAATLSGGYAVVLGDLLTDAGLPVASLADATKARLTAEVVQAHPSNPADIGSRPSPGMELQDLANGLSILHDDPGVGAVYFGEMSFLGMDRAAPVLADFAARATKPFVVCWQGGPYTEIIRKGLRERRVIAFDTPAVAMRALKAVHDYGRMMATPAPEAPSRRASRLATAAEGLMAEADAYALLADCGIDVARWRLAATPAEAGAAARTLGGRVALKGQAPGIAHKSEHGLVRLGLDALEVEAAAAEMARRAPATESFLVQEMAPKGIEILAGIVTDPHVGPAVVLGFGGIYAEAMGQPAVEVAPVDRPTALAMIARIDRKGIFDGYRTGTALAKDALADLVVALSRLAHEERARLREADLNPVIIGERRALAVDALLRLGPR